MRQGINPLHPENRSPKAHAQSGGACKADGRRSRPNIKTERQASALAIFHCSVGSAKSACGSDAYNEGKDLKDKKTDKYYYYGKREDVVYTETILAQNAPQEWQDSTKLWQAASEAEEKIGAREAKKIEVALPAEWDRERQKEACREYAQKFVDMGQCVTLAIHDKGDGNPHCHMLLTLREIDENGKFKKYKSKGVYNLDENGNRIPLIDPETGQQKIGKRNEKLWKRHKEEDIPCSSKEYVENCRQWWEDTLNKRLEEKDKVSCKSYEAQGIDRMPTIHEGYGEKAEENREKNRLIKLYNELARKTKELIKELGAEILGRTDEILGKNRGTEQETDERTRGDREAERRKREAERRERNIEQRQARYRAEQEAERRKQIAERAERERQERLRREAEQAEQKGRGFGR